MPGSGLLEMLMATGYTLMPDSARAVALCTATLSAPLLLDTKQQRVGQVRVDSAQGRVEALSIADGGRSQAHCAGRLVQAAAVTGQPCSCLTGELALQPAVVVRSTAMCEIGTSLSAYPCWSCGF